MYQSFLSEYCGIHRFQGTLLDVPSVCPVAEVV